MKRLHVYDAVDDITRSVGFYSTLFGAEPAVLDEIGSDIGSPKRVRE